MDAGEPEPRGDLEEALVGGDEVRDLGAVPLLELAYACIGIYVGLRFTRETLRLTVTALPGILAATSSVIALCAAWGWGLTLLLPTDQYKAGESTFVTVLDRVGFHVGGVHMADIMTVVLITAVASSMNSGLYSTGRVLRSMAQAGTAPRYLSKMSATQVPYAGIFTTAGFGLIGVGINYIWPSNAFEIALEIATLGIIGVWSMILISHWMMVRKAERGELERPDFRLRGAPWLNLFGLLFLLFVLVLIGFGDDPKARLAVWVGGPVVAVLMIGGWFVVRHRIDASAFDEGMV